MPPATSNPDTDADGTLLRDDDFLILINAWWEDLEFVIPADAAGRGWSIVSDSFETHRAGPVGAGVSVGPRSVVVLRAPGSAAKTRTAPA